MSSEVCWDKVETQMSGCFDARRQESNKNGVFSVILTVPEKHHTLHYEVHDDYLFAHGVYIKDTRHHNQDTSFTFMGKCVPVYDNCEYTKKCSGLVVPSYEGTNDRGHVAERCEVMINDNLSHTEYFLPERNYGLGAVARVERAVQ